jgi:hypothetical protein
MVLLAARVAVAIDHGGLEDLIPFAVETAGSTTYGRVASEAVAFSMLELGRPDLARSLVEPFAHGNDLPDDYTTLLGAAATVHVRIELGDVEAAEPAAALLAPYADRWSGAGISPLTMGPVSLALALHRAALGDDRADADFVESVAACETNGAVGWLARSLAHQADFLDVHGDLAGAAGARSRAWDLATRHGLPYVLRRLDAVAST